MVFGAGTVDFISMTEPAKLPEKAIGGLNATWNSVKKRVLQVPSCCLRRFVHLWPCSARRALSRDVNHIAHA